MKKLIVLFVIFGALLGLVYYLENREKKQEEAKEKEENLLKLEKNEISELEITRDSAEPVLISKSGSEWVLRKPVETPADAATVDGLVGALKNAKIERTLEKVTSADLDKYGLTQPRAVVDFKAGKDQRTVLVGSDDFTGNQVYVQLKGKPDVYLTSDYLYNSLDKQLKDWRSRKVLAFDRATTQVVEIVRGQETIRLRKQDDKWFLDSPVKEPADEGTVSGLLSSVEFAEAQNFLSEQPDSLKAFGLDKPEVTLRIREQGKDSWKTLEIGRKEGEAYVARNPARTPVFTVTSEVRDKLAQTVSDFRDKSVVDVTQDQVSEILFRRPSGELVVKQQSEGKWLVQKPDPMKGKEALTYKFWYPLVDIKFQSIQDSGKPAAWAKPEIEVVVTLKNGSKRSFHFARNGEEYFARKVEGGREGKISKESFEALQFKPEDIV